MRQRTGLHCRSEVNILKAERDVYGAIVDDRVALKMGPGHWEPGAGWRLSVEGDGYKVWEREN